MVPPELQNSASGAGLDLPAKVVSALRQLLSTIPSLEDGILGRAAFQEGSWPVAHVAP